MPDRRSMDDRELLIRIDERVERLMRKDEKREARLTRVERVMLVAIPLLAAASTDDITSVVKMLG